MTTTVLISGASSGIGRALVAQYAAQPGTLVIAAVRDAAAADLAAVPTAAGSRVAVAAGYDARRARAGADLIARVQAEHGVTSLDTVVAGAGVSKHWGSAATEVPEDTEEHFLVNAAAPLQLYAAAAPLLAKSSVTPRFIVIGSVAGTHAEMEKYTMFQMTAYMAAKSAINFAVARIHREDPRLIVFAIHPGWTQTAIGYAIATNLGAPVAAVPSTAEATAGKVAAVIAAADKATVSGKLVDQDGVVLGW